MRALITGGSGLLGSWLAKALLERGDGVVVYGRHGDRPSALRMTGAADHVAVVLGDVRDREALDRALAEHAIDTIFHLAAQTLVGVARQAPAVTFDVNVRGTWTVLEAARAAGVERVVTASSAKVYGRSGELPSVEDQPLDAAHPYDASKAAADVIARSYWHGYGLPVAVARLANVYGGGDLNASRLVPETVWAALAERAPVIRSDGTPRRDFLHVEDAVRAYLAIADALEAPGARGEAFNAGGGSAHAVLDVVRLTLQVAGARVEPDVRGAGTPAGELDCEYVDHTKLSKLTGWRPQVELVAGLRATVEWYRRHAPQPPSQAEVASTVGR